MNSEIQIGLPCAYEGLCFWLGVGFGVAVATLVAYFIFQAWKENRDKRVRRELRRQKRQRSK